MSAGGGNQMISVLPDELKFQCILSLSLSPYLFAHTQALGNQMGMQLNYGGKLFLKNDNRDGFLENLRIVKEK